MRNLLIAAILLFQLILGFLYYSDFRKCCNSAASAPEISDSVIRDQSIKPLIFSWKDSTAITGSGWAAYKDSLLAAMGSDKKLEIKGISYNTEDVNNLANARALSVRNLFPELSDDRIIMQAMASNAAVDTLSELEAVGFSIVSPEAKIKVEATKTLIYFGANSIEKLNSKEVEAYLDEIAARVIQSGEKISLTGHTDNIGPEAENVKLGLQRAETVKKYLVSKGVPASSVMTESKGESEPTADNSTADGRAKNRRTELTIIQ